MRHLDFSLFCVSFTLPLYFFIAVQTTKVNLIFQYLSCLFSVQKSGGLLSPANYACLYMLFLPQYCTGSTHVDILVHSEP